MARGPLTFKQRDLTAALKAARDAGFTVARVLITSTGAELDLRDGIDSNTTNHDTSQHSKEKNDWEDAV